MGDDDDYDEEEEEEEEEEYSMDRVEFRSLNKLYRPDVKSFKEFRQKHLPQWPQVNGVIVSVASSDDVTSHLSLCPLTQIFASFLHAIPHSDTALSMLTRVVGSCCMRCGVVSCLETFLVLTSRDIARDWYTGSASALSRQAEAAATRKRGARAAQE